MNASSGRKRGGVWVWLLLVVLVVLVIVTIATRDRTEREASQLQKPDLHSYAGVKEFAKAGPEQPGSLAAVWKDVVRAARFRKPEFKEYEAANPPSDPCTKNQKDWKYAGHAYYCPETKTIYWDDSDLKRYHEAYGYVRTMLVFAHEYGHHVSQLRGEHTVFDVQEELQADCLAGIYWRRAFRTLDPALYPGLSYVSLKMGIIEWFNRTDKPKRLGAWFEPGLHGEPAQRAIAFHLGFGRNSLRLCELVHQNFGRPHIHDVGPYQVAVVKGTSVKAISSRHIRVTRDQSRAEVRYLATRGRVSVGDAYERYRRAVANDGGVSDLTLLFLDSADHSQDWPAYSQRRYQRAHVENGERLISHGVVRLVVQRGGVVAFETRAAGSAPATDAESWRRMEDYLQELYVGTSWWFRERRRRSE